MRPRDFRFVLPPRDDPRHRRRPAVEPARRRSGIEDEGSSPSRPREALQEMMTRVQEDVGDRIPDLPRRPQNAEVIAAVEDRFRQGKGALDRPRDPRPDRLHPTGERTLSRGLDQEMDVDFIVAARKLKPRWVRGSLAPLSSAPTPRLASLGRDLRRSSRWHQLDELRRHDRARGRPRGSRRFREGRSFASCHRHHRSVSDRTPSRPRNSARLARRARDAAENGHHERMHLTLELETAIPAPDARSTHAPAAEIAAARSSARGRWPTTSRAPGPYRLR
jgi:hypothetical protein